MLKARHVIVVRKLLTKVRDGDARILPLRDVEHVLRHRDGVVLDGQGSRNLRLDRPDASSSEVRIVAAMR